MANAIVDNVKPSPRIFISHRHKDEPIIAALVGLLQDAFYIETHDIRCTSVQPYTLAPGERTSEILRSEIARAELVIGVLSPDTSESNYVLCELGASWGRDVPTFPLLVRGATYADVPSPLSERHSMSLEKEENCLQLMDYVARGTSLRRREGVSGKVAQQAKVLAVAAQAQSMTGIPGRRVHGYSGIWDVQNRFSLWHDIQVNPPDKVHWNGQTLVRLREDGKQGYGMQIGQLKVELGQYRATWNVAQCQAYRQQYGMNAIYLLPVNLYGPRDNFDPASSHVIPALIRKCVEAVDEDRDEIVCWGDGSPSREFLYVEDCAEGIVAATERYDGSDPVNLGSGREIFLRDLVQQIAALTGFRGRIVWDTTQPNGQPRRCLDVSRAERAFGWRARTGFEEGLRRTVDYYLASRNVAQALVPAASAHGD